jgi:hypothetical protein
MIGGGRPEVDAAGRGVSPRAVRNEVAMNESEWNACTEPQQMLQFLRDSGRASDRKLRLFACACCRRDRDLLESYLNLMAVERSEGYADGLVSYQELKEIRRAVQDGLADSEPSAACWAAGRRAGEAAVATLRKVIPGLNSPSLVALLRDIFGNPFRSPPVLNPSLLTWHGGTVDRLAEAIYKQRDLPSGTLDNACLAMLANALEKAGLNDQEVLGHLREQGAVHFRGCWPIDLILGKA